MLGSCTSFSYRFDSGFLHSVYGAGVVLSRGLIHTRYTNVMMPYFAHVRLSNTLKSTCDMLDACSHAVRALPSSRKCGVTKTEKQ